MMIALWLMCVMYSASVYCAGAGAGAGGKCRYAFYREMYGEGEGEGDGDGDGEQVQQQRSGAGGGGGTTRRVFGGEKASSDAWPAACVLLDRYWQPRCSGSVVADRWILTAAHCVTPRLAYVKYNTNRPSADDGSLTPVFYLYRHPEYKVVQEDLGRGTDVTLLHHDVGLVRTADVMKLRVAPPLPAAALRSITTYTINDINGEVVQILGFGRTEKLAQGEELVSARLRVVSCERGTWVPCVCGVSGGAGSEPTPAGVCSGDSGGPVVYRGSQVAVVSMGPVECAASASSGGPRAEDAPTSVFTAIYDYAPLINATILDTDNALRMLRIPLEADVAAAATPSPPLLLLATLLIYLTVTLL